MLFLIYTTAATTAATAAATTTATSDTTFIVKYECCLMSFQVGWTLALTIMSSIEENVNVKTEFKKHYITFDLGITK